jgi:hypothetical protein
MAQDAVGGNRFDPANEAPSVGRSSSTSSPLVESTKVLCGPAVLPLGRAGLAGVFREEQVERVVVVAGDDVEGAARAVGAGRQCLGGL